MENYKVSERSGRRESEWESKRRLTEQRAGMARCGKASEAKKECRSAKANNKCIIKR